MFKLDLSPAYLWPVKFSVVDARGVPQTHEIKILFKRFNGEQVKAIENDINHNARTQSDNERDGVFLSPKDHFEREVNYLLRVMEGWEGVDLGGSTEFSRDNLTTLINAVPNLIGAIWTEFFSSATGGQKRKN